MKRNIKNIILVLLFALFTVVAVSALNQSDVDLVDDSLSKLATTQLELQAVKGTSDISRIISLSEKLLTKAVSNPGTSCVAMLKTSLLKLDQAIDRLESRGCAKSKRKNCIQSTLADKVLTDLQSATDSLKQITALDGDGNKIPDICENDPDNDGLIGKKDNCPLTSNSNQLDADKNKVGDACQLFYCCETSSLTVPLSECEKKTAESCSESGGIVIGGIPAHKPRGLRNKTTTLRNNIDFGELSMVTVSTGFFPFESSQNVLNTFNTLGCSDIDITFTQPVGFSGGLLEVGPAANNFETGPRTSIQFDGDMSSTITVNNYPTTDPVSGQPFNPSMGDVIGLSLFTDSAVFLDSIFHIFVDTSKVCVSAPTSSGGASSSSGGTSGGGVVVVASSSSGDFNSMLQGALTMSTVPVTQGGMQYVVGTHDCDDFANELERELDGQGFDASFTLIWRDNGMEGHAVTDVHPPGGETIFIEPQDGTIIPLDEDGDGMVGFRDGVHSDAIMNTEGMSEIEVYMDQDSAVMAGVTLD